MKKKFTFMMAAVMLLVFMTSSLAGWGQTTWTWTAASGDLGTSATINATLNGMQWTGTRDDATYTGWSNSHIQLGSRNNPDEVTLQTSGFSNATITSVSVICYSYNGVHKISITVGDEVFLSSTSTGSSSNTITGTGSASGDIEISFTKGSGARALYIKGISVTYSTGGTPTPSMSVSTNAIDFGNENTINPSEPYTATFDVTFANLTEDLSVSVGSGLTGVLVSPTSIAANATSPQTVTVSYNPTEEGNLNGNITVSSSEVTAANVAVTGSAYDPANVDTYEKYTGALVEGDYVIYANNYALKNTLNNGPRFNNESVTPANNTITNPDVSIIWHIAPIENTNYWTIYNTAISKYAGGTSTKNQGALLDEINDFAKWDIYYQTGILYIANYGRSQGSDPNNKFIRQNGTNGWATYAIGTGAAPQLYKKVIANQVAQPTFSVAAGTYYETQSVELSCETTGATIYYTTDGTNPAINGTEYTTAISVSSTMTIKAIAMKDGMTDSDVATAAYTIEQPYSTIQDLFDDAINIATDVTITFGGWVVSAIKNNNAYLTDNQGHGLIIYASNHGFQVNDVLTGTASCKLQLYNGSAELINLTASTTGLNVAHNGTVTEQNIAINELGGINTGALLAYQSLTYNGSALVDGNNNTITPYSTLYDGTFENDMTYNVKGIYLQYNNTKEILPRSAADIVVAPEIVISGNEIENDEVNLAYNDETKYTASVTYNHMDTPESDDAAVGLYNDASCETTFDGGWFIADFAINSVTTIEYVAEPNNTNAIRTVYMRVEVLDDDYIYSNVIEVTQAAAPATALYTYSVNGVEGEPVDALVGDEIDLAAGSDLDETYSFAGWTTNSTDVTTRHTGKYTLTDELTIFYAVYAKTVPSTVEKVVVLDGTNFPENYTTEVTTFTENGITYTTYGAKQTDVQGNATNCFKKTTAILMQKTYQGQPGYLYNTTAFGEGITKFEVYANKGASTSAAIAINFSATAIESFDAEAEYTYSGTLNPTDAVYDASTALPTGAKYFWFQSTNVNDQVQFRITYNDEGSTTAYYTRVYDATTTTIDNIPETSVVTVPNGVTLTLTGTNKGDETNLIIEDGGQLITSKSVKATFKKTTTASTEAKVATNNWYAISSPVNEIAISSFATGTHNVYSYIEKSHYWNEYRGEANATLGTAPFENLENGRGYLYRSTASGIDFKGDVNVDDATYTLTYTPAAGNLAGFHLIGNPYTHNIYKGANAAINSDYLTDGLYTLNVNGGWETGTDNTTAIAPGCAVLVQAKEEAGAGQTLTITNTDHQGPLARYANDQIMFTVENSEYSDNSYVLFKKGQGLNKIEHRNAEIPMLYVISEGENFAIADMPDNTSVINLGFEAKTMGQYTISLKAEGQYSYMHLVDKLTGNDIDMLVEDSYTFVGTPNDRNDRFVLRLNYNAAGIDTESDIFAYQSGNDIMVSGEGELQVFDITGRKVMTTDINGVETINGMNRGVYIFRLNEKTQKIVVR